MGSAMNIYFMIGTMFIMSVIVVWIITGDHQKEEPDPNDDDLDEW
jgi:hypothetical protein